MLNKCSNPGCNNHVIHNRYDLCPPCHKAAEEAKNPVKRHKCAGSDCDHMIPEQYEFCVPCRKAKQREEDKTSEQHKCETCDRMIPLRYTQCNRCFTGKAELKVALHKCPTCDNQIPVHFHHCAACIKAYKAKQNESARRLAVRMLRGELLTEYKSDCLREGAVVEYEVADEKAVIAFEGVKHEFEDRSGIVAARNYARKCALQRAADKAHEAERSLRAELLTEVQTSKLREGAVIKSRHGSQVIVIYQGKSYTLTDEAGALHYARSKKDAEALKRQQELEAERKAEATQRARREKERELFAQYKKGELAIVHEERKDTRITLLLESGETVSFDDLDEIEAREQRRRDEAVATAAAVKASRAAQKRENKKGKGGKKGKDQRKAA